LLNALSLLKLLIGLAGNLAEYVRQKKLMDAGAAEATLKGLRDADDAIRRAADARAHPVGLSDDPDNRDTRQ
jgi:hypothetical protein